MLLRQISVFLENKSGRLAEVTRLLGEAKVNIRALTLADTADFGILRLIVNDVALAEKVLRENGFTVGLTEVVAIEVPDRPGGLAGVLADLGKAGINVEYMYAFVARSSGNAVVIFRFDEAQKAIGILAGQGVKVLPANTVYNL